VTALPSYRHVQPYTVLWVLLPLTCGVTLWIALMTHDVPALELALLAGLPLALLLGLGRLVIEIDGPVLRWRFGWLGWPRWQVALSDIVAVEKTRAPGAAGSGIRNTGQGRLYNVAIGGPAVALALRDGRRILLGTPEPEKLAAFVEARRTGRA
jgi:hypothetical protein